jgi:signal transduction histidine kinase
MRPQDVLNKWLVLATDSSHRPIEEDDGWLKYADEDQRKWMAQPKYGEKGIGRLSVSSLGRMVFLWTVWGQDSEKVGSLCLVHWNLFQHPGKLFEDLPIPFLTLDRPATPKDMAALLAQLRDDSVVKDLIADERWSETLRNELEADIAYDCGKIEPWPFGWKNGTTFCVLGLSDQVPELFLKGNQDIQPGEEYSPEKLKAYHAFASFWDPFHKHSDRPFIVEASKNGVLLPRTSRYWEPSDFKECDHHIRIEVSEGGFASGTIHDFGKKPIKYQRQLKHLPKGYKTPGSFLVEVGYVQGKGSEEFSNLPADTFREVNERLEHAGGFSIYRNHVRIQPYGTIDNDFFGFEQRRLKNAGRYYFSTRRMFGGIFLPSEKAPALQEKAGREGFVANGARRALWLWVEDLFIDLADSHYGRKANREDKRTAKKKKEAERARKRLIEEKAAYLEDIRVRRGWLRDFSKRTQEGIRMAKGFVSSERNAEPGTHLKSCKDALEALRLLASELRGSTGEAPVGVVLEGDELEAAEKYLTNRGEELRRLDRAIANLTQDIEALIHRAEGEEEQVLRYRQRITDTESRIRKEVDSIMKPVLERASDLVGQLTVFVEDELNKTFSAREEALDGLSMEKIAKDSTGESAKKLERAIQLQEDAFEEVVRPRLKRLANEIAHLTDDASGTLVLQEMADELGRLREREAFLVEMAQLGLIAETASHEHEHQVTVVRDCIGVLKKKIDQALGSTLTGLSDAFEIIDARIRLFDPLIRRSGVVSQTITGEEIEGFLKHHFDTGFDSGLVEVTPAFRKASLPDVKKPVMLGAIHNIVHNALYWCKQGTEKPAIRLTGAGSKITVSDSGPGIAKRDRLRIFEPGFSRRPFGRGLGLFIAKEALAGIGFDLSCPTHPEPGALDGANFLIQPLCIDDEQD